MAVLIVPELDDQPWPTLGPQMVSFIEDRCVFGPGSLAGRQAALDAEKKAALYRLYEVYPAGHRLAGRRRFKRGGIEWRKGLAKTEFAAWVSFCELHPEAPARCDGFDANGNPVGRPVMFPYIPMMATSEEQVSELAYGVLKYVVEEGPDADLFDSGLDRIIRLGARGQNEGQVVPVSNAPNSRDGALTTFQCFDEPHRLYLPNQKNAHETMTANLEKRVLEDPWSLYTSTAGQPGQNSIQEDLRKEAEDIDKGLIDDPQMFFFARWAGPEHKDLTTLDLRVAAISEATGPIGEYGPGQFESIARQWDRKGADKSYLERVWLNRWQKSAAQAFDLDKWKTLARPDQKIPDGAFVTIGFDGARFRDATAFVVTDIETGLQMGGKDLLWEQDPKVEDWEVDEDEVTAKLEELMKRFNVWKLYGDPPHWTETMGSWSAKYPDQVEEWWTARKTPMSYAVRAFTEGIDAGIITHTGAEDYTRHIGNAGRRDLRILDDQGQPLWTLGKIELDRKFDQAMAGVLSWKACLDARKSGAKPRRKKRSVIRRLR
ncbi:large terminase [Arthrobacter sp. SX1312]|uniref:large terminase n=1 Tax=Arthrobacter sp. SX1312 TaxID=2058896 RepID=UPI000CE3AE89|nr:large terminase [Arthrobacter sp. SX1312]